MTFVLKFNDKKKLEFTFEGMRTPPIVVVGQYLTRFGWWLRSKVQPSEPYIQPLNLISVDGHIDVQIEDIQPGISRRMQRHAAISIIKALGVVDVYDYHKVPDKPRYWERC